jgi:hypothetical protein
MTTLNPVGWLRRMLMAAAIVGAGALGLGLLAPAGAQANPYCYAPYYNPYYCAYYSGYYPYYYGYPYYGYPYYAYPYYGFAPVGISLGFGFGGHHHFHHGGHFHGGHRR